MRAVLPVSKKNQDGSSTEEMLLFDTETATELCSVFNAYGNEVEKIFISPGGILFSQDTNRDKELKVENQDATRKYIGQNHPEVYEKVFGKVKEA